MQNLTVTLIQTNLIWTDIDANLALMETKIDGIQAPTDVIILPEMFSTGFSMAAPKLAESMTGRTIAWMRSRSAEHGAAIIGSLIIKEAGRYYNRLVCSHPDGMLTCYDKKHLFRYAGEEKVFTAGASHVEITICGWRIRPFICYDLRFPIWTRNLDLTYDLAVFVANWPAARAAHWKSLLMARAIENQAYVIGVNRIGRDGEGNTYNGDSMVVSPQGEVLAAEGDRDSARTITLNHEAMAAYRRKFPAWMDADQALGIALNDS